MKIDKLDRWRTCRTAVATQEHGVPFWVTLTPRERTKGKRSDVFWFYRSKGDDRRRFRCFVRSWMLGEDQPFRPSKRAQAIADRYSAVLRRHAWDRDSVAYKLANRRLWVLRHGAAYGEVCVN